MPTESISTSDGRLEALQRQAETLRELECLKSDFLRLTVHELRRPLGLVNGYAAMLCDGTLGDISEHVERGLQAVKAAAQEMQALVDGLAGIAQAEDHACVLRRQPSSLGHLVSEAVRRTACEATVKEITVELLRPDPDVMAEVDRNLLGIAVTNLLGNAIKYAPRGSVVRVAVSQEQTVTVADQGPGIDSAQAARIFERWTRGPDVSVPGLGLGLYIVRRIADLHGGEVALASVVGLGSTFVLSLPDDTARNHPPLGSAP